MTIQERIKEIEDEIKKTQKNKATEKHIGLLKARMSKLEQDAEKYKKTREAISTLGKIREAFDYNGIQSIIRKILPPGFRYSWAVARNLPVTAKPSFPPAH